ncbi:hypothetical protein Slala03_51380 [Streptomyces lavendulae subsp. lavendulae]|nr:hypothetical protein Slala03_51380 [Streptomyces lavendulae subsp. lavendulae]
MVPAEDEAFAPGVVLQAVVTTLPATIISDPPRKRLRLSSVLCALMSHPSVKADVMWVCSARPVPFVSACRQRKGAGRVGRVRCYGNSACTATAAAPRAHSSQGRGRSDSGHRPAAPKVWDA